MKGYIDDLLFDRDLQFIEEISPGLTTHFRSTTVVAQLKAVAAGAGIGIIPYFMAHGESELVSVLPDHNIEREYWLQVHCPISSLPLVLLGNTQILWGLQDLLSI